jgi:hypothetical protein
VLICAVWSCPDSADKHIADMLTHTLQLL